MIDRKAFMVLKYSLLPACVRLPRRSAWCPVRWGRPSNREECSLRFETPDNAGNEQRGVLGSALLEEEYVLRCLSGRAITEAA
jgi:hypothetical protein